MDRRLKIEVFMTGLESEMLIKTGLIMKKKETRENMSGKKANGAQEVCQQARREGCNA